MARRWFPNVYEGWIVVGSAALVVLLIGATFYYGFGVFFNDIIQEFGWSVAATSLAFSLRSEIGGLAAPFVGVGIDRYGARRVIILGVIVAATGVLLLSLIQNMWQFYAAMVVIAIGSSGAGGQAGLAAIATWFERRRALAMSLSTLGGGVAGILVVVIARLVEEFGWRIALRILVVGMVVIGVAFGSFIRTRPRDHDQPMDGREYHDASGAQLPRAVMWGIPPRLVVRTPAFWFSGLAMIALSFSTTAVLVHQVPYMETHLGLSKSVAGSTVALYTLFSIVGRLGLGMLGDRVSKRVLIAFCALLIGSGTIAMALATEFWQVVLAIMLISPGFGGTIPTRPAMMADYFGTRHFGTVNGIAALMNTTGGALGPWAVGYIVDVTGQYTTGWYLAAGVGLLAAPLVLLAAPPRTLADRYRAEAVAAHEASGGREPSAGRPPGMH
ncbi:MAG: MFS transporter [Dehalococcoidia bacterium]